MATEPDLSNSITMHPHPFPMHANRSEHRYSSGGSSTAAPTYLPLQQMRNEARPASRRERESRSSTPVPGPSKQGATTAYEAVTPPIENHDPISRHVTTDVESRPSPRYTRDNDPYHLSSAIKTDVEMDMIRANTSRKRDGCGPITFNEGARKARKLQGFYESQNENIERLLKPVDDHRAEAKQEQGDNLLKYQIAVYGSFAANLVLAGLQVYGAVASGSLSLFTTMADAVFDPLSNVTLIASNRAVNKVDSRRFPSGKARIETAGNIMFCFIMTAVSWILIVLSARDLASPPNADINKFHLPSTIAVAVAFCTKLCLFLYCWALKDTYSQINILWQDHRNDLFINGFGILTSVGGAKLRWWIDPMGAIILSILISVIWLRTAFSEFHLLVGVTADTEMQQLITYIAVTHSSQVNSIDTVRVYHSGPRLICEVDIVMDPQMSLRETHDVAEALQFKLESLPDVERAYVHVDYEVTHKPEHFLKKEL